MVTASEHPSTGSIEEVKEIGTDDRSVVKRWLIELDLAQKAQKRYVDVGRKIVRKYRDADSDEAASDPNYERNDVRFNIMWSTIQTVQPALYARTPQPVVRRRFKDKDQLGRYAAEILQDSVSYYLKSYDFDDVMRACRDDYLLTGRGQSWVRYVPTFKLERELIRLNEGDEPPKEYEIKKDDEGHYYERPYDTLDYEEVVCDYVYWEDFLHSPARNWQDVRWVAKREYLTKKQVEERFGDEAARDVNYSSTYEREDYPAEEDSPTKHELFKKAQIWEIWNKEDGKVYWICPTYKEAPLDTQDDPLGLAEFYPCPKPLLATTTTDTLEPVADFKLVQDIAKELDVISKRISLITEAVKVFGAYDPACIELEEIFNTDDNQLFPAKSWDSFAKQGGFQGVVQFFPIDQMVASLAQLNDQKARLVQDYYEISGYSDIFRGASNPHETAYAQQIKGRFATLRLSSRQQEMQRFARDVVALKAAIIAGKFQPDTIALVTGEVFDEDDEEASRDFDDALVLLSDELQRSFRIDIETDSTVAINEDVEKQERVEFLNMFSQFFGQIMGIAESMPAFMPAATEALLFGVRAFRAGRPLEESIEGAIDDYIEQKRIEAEQEPPPDPEMVKIQEQSRLKEQEQQMDFQLKQSELQFKMQEAQQKFQMKQQDVQADWQVQYQRIMADMQAEREKLGMQAEKMRGELNLQAEKMREELVLQAEEMRSELQVKVMGHQLDAQVKAASAKKPEGKKDGDLNVTIEAPK